MKCASQQVSVAIGLEKGATMVPKRWNRALGLLVSAAMVVGLVPAPALAEVVEEVQPAQEALPADEVDEQQSSTDVAVEESVTSTEPAATEPAAAEPTQPEQANPQPSVEDSNQKDQSVEEAEAPKEAPKAPAAESKAKEAEASAPKKSPAPQRAASDVTPVTITLDTDIAASAEEGSYWLGRFTAPENAEYVFSATGDYDTYAELYSDETFEDLLEENDDDGEGSNFRLRYSLSAGQTVYLKVRPYSEGEMSCTLLATVFDMYDLSHGQINSLDVLLSDNMVVNPSVYDADDNYLTQGEDFELLFFTYDDEAYTQLSAAPTTEGTFYMVARGLGNYHGETQKAPLNIYDLNNIGSSEWMAHFEGYEDYTLEFDYSGNPVVLPEISVFRRYWDDDLGEDVEIKLVQGKDFETVGYRDNTGSVSEEVPRMPGSYGVVVEGKGDYYGTRDIPFTILVDVYDLSFGSICLDWDTYDYTGEPVDIRIGYLEDADCSLVYDDDYDLVFYDKDGVELQGAPVEAGSYAVAARGKGSYHGESPRCSFAILDANDIGGSMWWARFEESSMIVETGKDVVLPLVSIVRSEDSAAGYVQLVEGKDFELAYFTDADGNRVSQAKDAGEYCAVYQGKGDYTGTRSLFFTIVAANDLGAADIVMEKSRIALASGVAIPQVKVYDATGKLLTEGTDYTLSYWQESTDEIVVAPNQVGEYEVWAEATPNGGYQGSTGRCGLSVYDPYDLSNGSWNHQFDGPAIQTGSELELPKPLIYCEDEDGLYEFLVEGADFVFDHYENEEGETIEDPLQADECFAIYQGKGAYHGSVSLWLEVVRSVSVNDLGDWNSSFKGGSEVSYTGKAVELPALVVYRYDENDNMVTLTQGTDYALDYYENENSETIDAPTACGTYWAVYSGIGSYVGSLSNEFSIVNPTDLASGQMDMVESNIITEGLPATPLTLVYDYNGKLLEEGKDYELVYYQYVDEGWEELSQAPTATGTYEIAARAKAGSGYTGITYRNSFAVSVKGDLSAGRFTLEEETYAFTGKPVSLKAKVLDANDTALVEGTDYELKFYAYGDNGYEPLGATPSESALARARTNNFLWSLTNWWKHNAVETTFMGLFSIV